MVEQEIKDKYQKRFDEYRNIDMMTAMAFSLQVSKLKYLETHCTINGVTYPCESVEFEEIKG